MLDMPRSYCSIAKENSSLPGRPPKDDPVRGGMRERFRVSLFGSRRHGGCVALEFVDQRAGFADRKVFDLVDSEAFGGQSLRIDPLAAGEREDRTQLVLRSGVGITAVL